MVKMGRNRSTVKKVKKGRMVQYNGKKKGQEGWQLVKVCSNGSKGDKMD